VQAQAPQVTFIGLLGVPLVKPGDDLVDIILRGVHASGETLRAGDVIVLAQKIVSKAEGRFVDLADVTPSADAIHYGDIAQKDPRIVELVLRESSEVLRCRPGVIVVAHRLGFVMANAGIDVSNVAETQAERVLLLPENPDRTCAAMRDELRRRTGIEVAVIVIDSIGRAWRNGTVGTAVGVSGIAALLDLRGRPDLHGRTLRATEIGLADEIASGASLIMGQGDEGRPIVLARGVPYDRRAGTAQELIRARELDLFR